MRLIWQNSLDYNQDDSEMRDITLEIQAFFEKTYKDYIIDNNI